LGEYWFLCFWVFELIVFFIFFKQKTAYEIQIRDWSSDVCSSDLPAPTRESRIRGVHPMVSITEP